MEDGEFEDFAEKDEIQSADNRHMSALKEVLQGLEDWQRMLLLMRSEGRPYSEIAKFVDRPEEQLKVYYQRLKETISKKIHERIQK
jgi:DNA-directed RNA polymerase specialized sigma24 family protein